jgi:hypothetical protein
VRKARFVRLSHYKAFQITLRHARKRLDRLAGYTYSKAEDQSSDVGEEVKFFIRSVLPSVV